MKKFVAIIIFAAIGWYGYQYNQQSGLPFLEGSTVSSSTHSSAGSMTKCITKEGEVIYGSVPSDTTCEKVEPVKGSLTIVSSDYFGSTFEPEPVLSAVETSRISLDSLFSGYSCRGKQYCSQMGSCEEALFYLNNCPNTKIDSDSDRDGVPCERQFCGG